MIDVRQRVGLPSGASVLPHLDGRRIRDEDVEALARWQPDVARTSEVSLVGGRVLLQDFTGVRTSLLNGCTYCTDMHMKVARSQGETEQRLNAVSVWRDSLVYSERERAALAWTDAVTFISIDHVRDDVYDSARQHFTEKELDAPQGAGARARKLRHGARRSAP